MISNDIFYKSLFYTSWILAIVGAICNTIALYYITLRRRKQAPDKKFKFDEIILLSLCMSNLMNSFLTSVDCAIMVIDKGGTLPVTIYQITGYGIAFALLVSLTNVIIFAFERLVSFRYPFFHRDLRRRYLIMLLFFCWSLSVLPTIQLHHRRSIYFLTLCGVMVFSNIFLILSYLYIFIVMKKTIKHGFAPSTPKQRKGSNKSAPFFTRERSKMQVKTTIMCLSIVISYFLCTVPPVIWMIVHKGAGITHRDGNTTVMSMYMLLLLRMVFDPLVYILRNKIFNFSMIMMSRLRFIFKETSFSSRRESIKTTKENISPYVITIDHAVSQL
uniref:G-protein coupled receptors family 1 profile domain-containing protein n=2 Tax=Clytia hemisphaerica TaxID=252671 RepID=A0A7M5WXQ7_9CNID